VFTANTSLGTLWMFQFQKFPPFRTSLFEPDGKIAFRFDAILSRFKKSFSCEGIAEATCGYYSMLQVMIS